MKAISPKDMELDIDSRYELANSLIEKFNKELLKSDKGLDSYTVWLRDSNGEKYSLEIMKIVEIEFKRVGWKFSHCGYLAQNRQYYLSVGITEF